MKTLFKILCVINLIGMIIGMFRGNIITVVGNGFSATVMAILSNDIKED